MKFWSNLAEIVFRRTYARNDFGHLEDFKETVERVIKGNTRGYNVSPKEIDRLHYFLTERKAGPAGRGWWFSGAPVHETLGEVANTNCWAVTSDDWMNFVLAADLLMLGGGVGLSVEHQYVSKLQRIKKGVSIKHKDTKDAIFIVPDSRPGWVELIRRVLKAYFYDGKSFEYSTVCIRGAGEKIKGFGGTSSGPIPLINLVTKLCAILSAREGKNIRPIDACDIICAIGEMVVSGNVRRSAILVLGDAYDKEFLKAKRWDLGPIPAQRSNANFSVVCEDIEDLHPLFWKTYEVGEPFGIVNRTNIQKFGRMGEIRKDSAILVNPCSESTLESAEGCNLQDLALPNLASVEEFEEAARLMHRWGKRVTLGQYHIPVCNEVMKRNRRIGTGITGCLCSDLFKPEILDKVYAAIQDENVKYSKELGIPESIRTTVVKPSGTLSKMFDLDGFEGIHAAFSRYIIQRVRFSSGDPAIPELRKAGHHIEPLIKLDGTLDHSTVVVDFYVRAPDGYPVADEDWDTWKQLEVVKMAQKYWADQAVSVTVYYKKEEISKLKAWLVDNLKYLKCISFLCQNDHGFKQAPKEAITKEQYEMLSAKITPIDVNSIGQGADLDGTECAGGACPLK
jgi:ribonucleoside-triphosphate reductase (thioredoxin)